MTEAADTIQPNKAWKPIVLEKIGSWYFDFSNNFFLANERIGYGPSTDIGEGYFYDGYSPFSIYYCAKLDRDEHFSERKGSFVNRKGETVETLREIIDIRREDGEEVGVTAEFVNIEQPELKTGHNILSYSTSVYRYTSKDHSTDLSYFTEDAFIEEFLKAWALCMALSDERLKDGVFNPSDNQAIANGLIYHANIARSSFSSEARSRHTVEANRLGGVRKSFLTYPLLELRPD